MIIREQGRRVTKTQKKKPKKQLQAKAENKRTVKTNLENNNNTQPRAEKIKI